MKIECVPNPKIVLTFTYDELKELRDSIEKVVADNKYIPPMISYQPGAMPAGASGTALGKVMNFVVEVSKIL